MKISFSTAFKDIWTTPNKWMTVLGLCVSMLIPIVGPMVAFGYLFRRYARVRAGYEVEDFDFQYFGEYLKFGLWPFLASLVASLVVVPIAMIGMAPMFAAPFVAENSETLAFAMMGIGFLLYTVILLVACVPLYAVMLRSGLRLDFKEGFRWSFLKSFTGKVGLSLIGYFLLLGLVSMPLMLLGYFALFIGVYIVAAIMNVALMHLLFQHYDLYVERGGEPIETNPELVKNLGTPPIPGSQPPAAPSEEG